MSIKILECEQGTEQWLRYRMGLPTASEASTILCSKDDQRSRDARRRYMLKLAGEHLTGRPMTTFSNAYMERGKEWEPEAREAYSIIKNREVVQVGFILNTDLVAGVSPDGLIGKNRILEIKTSEPHILIAAWDKNEFPGEHKAQCQFALMAAERDKVDCAIYCRDLPVFIAENGRDESYIARLKDATLRFNEELGKVIEFMKRNGAEVRLDRVA
jgi:hypothetical protein